ncbi:MAG: hypothetical protein LQ338_002989 [Usnochroma carphineum]|nr:MAG: hypothetical protein LQ338_002989 [Usnochroma carphineum]
MGGGLVLARLPEWKEGEKEDTLDAIPGDAKRKTRNWRILDIFRKKKGEVQETGFSVQRKKPAQGRMPPQKDSEHDGAPSQNSAVQNSAGQNSVLKQDSRPRQERGRAIQASPARNWVPVVVKAKILQNRSRHALACFSVPPTATYREFICESFKVLRRQSHDPSRFPTRILVDHMVADWHKSRWSQRWLPGRLDENNFQGCLLRYSRCMDDEPVEIELMFSGMALPGDITRREAFDSSFS